MTKKKILYISWQMGMGHITRSVAIAREIQRQIPDVELSWLASPLASRVLEEAGEQLLPESALSGDYGSAGEKATDGFGLNLMKYVFYGRKEWAQNTELFKQVTSKRQFDLVVGDETYELMFSLLAKRIQIKTPFVMIHDFVGVVAMTSNLLEKLFVYVLNRRVSLLSVARFPLLTHLFIGEPEDVRDRGFGFCLPNCREWTRENCKFLGYVIRFEPGQYQDKAKIRAKLGYGEEPLVICSIGGTSVGKELLELCGQAYPIIKEEVPDLRMVLVCGPRLSPESLKVPQAVEVTGYVPALYEHFAASDLAIVQAGGTSTLELTALRRPFIYFPVEEHFEQAVHGVERLARLKAGIMMSYSQTTPKTLAQKVISNLGKEVSYAPIPTDGAQKAAQLISHLL